jgi:hypothetical protein
MVTKLAQEQFRQDNIAAFMYLLEERGFVRRFDCSANCPLEIIIVLMGGRGGGVGAAAWFFLNQTNLSGCILGEVSC